MTASSFPLTKADVRRIGAIRLALKYILTMHLLASTFVGRYGVSLRASVPGRRESALLHRERSSTANEIDVRRLSQVQRREGMSEVLDGLKLGGWFVWRATAPIFLRAARPAPMALFGASAGDLRLEVNFVQLTTPEH